MHDSLLKRRSFLNAGIVIFAFFGAVSLSSFGRKESKHCKDRVKPEGDKSPQKFLHAFTGKKFKDLPTNPVSY